MLSFLGQPFDIISQFHTYIYSNLCHLMFRSAPWYTRSSTISRRPFPAALWRGVHLCRQDFYRFFVMFTLWLSLTPRHLWHQVPPHCPGDRRQPAGGCGGWPCGGQWCRTHPGDQPCVPAPVTSIMAENMKIFNIIALKLSNVIFTFKIKWNKI